MKTPDFVNLFQYIKKKKKKNLVRKLLAFSPLGRFGIIPTNSSELPYFTSFLHLSLVETFYPASLYVSVGFFLPVKS